MPSELHRQQFSSFLKTSSLTQPTHSSVLLITGHPKCSASSTLLLNFKNLCSFNYLFFKIYLQHLESFCTIFTSLSQNLMQTYFLGTPKLQMGNTRVYSNRHYYSTITRVTSFPAGSDSATLAPSTLNGNSLC
jgi:hypothetical protein